MTTNQKSLLVFCFIIGFALGFAVERSIANKEMATTQARLVELGIVPPDTTGVRHLTGTVKSVSGNSFVLSVQYPADPTGDAGLQERTVTVGEKTTITLLTPRDPEIVKKEMVKYEKELAEYQKAIAKLSPQTTAPLGPKDLPHPPVFPMPSFDKKDVNISVLKEGQSVSVLAGIDVKNQKSFVAQSVEIIPPPSVVPAGTTSIPAK